MNVAIAQQATPSTSQLYSDPRIPSFFERFVPHSRKVFLTCIVCLMPFTLNALVSGRAVMLLAKEFVNCNPGGCPF